MNKGYVYIITNEIYENSGIYKIGRSIDVDQRIKQLSGDTGVISDFYLKHKVYVKDCHMLEKMAHNRFDGNRVNKRREFFKIDLQEAIDFLESNSIDMKCTPVKHKKTTRRFKGSKRFKIKKQFRGEKFLYTNTNNNQNVKTYKESDGYMIRKHINCFATELVNGIFNLGIFEKIVGYNQKCGSSYTIKDDVSLKIHIDCTNITMYYIKNKYEIDNDLINRYIDNKDSFKQYVK